MRSHPKIDANHTAIVKALRERGCSVQSLASVGKGCPDILVGLRKQNFLLEIKDGAKIPSKRTLTEHEQKFFDTWTGQVAKVESVEEALAAVGLK